MILIYLIILFPSIKSRKAFEIFLIATIC